MQKIEMIDDNRTVYKRYYDNHKAQRNAYTRKYYQEHKPQLLEWRKKHDAEHKQEIADNAKKYSLEHKDQLKEYNKRYYHENKQKRIDNSSRWNNEHKEITKERMRHYNLKRYGITLVQYNQMFTNQNGVCAICGKKSNQSLAVDHDHITGKVRGLLCAKCNGMLGMCDDNKDILVNALSYLR